MPQDPEGIRNLNPLERALPGVISKLKALRASLNTEEQIVLQEILAAAASQSEVLLAHEQGPPGIIFSKSMSVHSSGVMKAEYIKLSKELTDPSPQAPPAGNE
jgi:hypothetical protein